MIVMSIKFAHIEQTQRDGFRPGRHFYREILLTFANKVSEMIRSFRSSLRAMPRVLTQRFRIGSVPIVNMRTFVAFFTLSFAASGLHPALGQSTAAAEWPTGSFDQQRDAWQRNETKFTVDNVKNIRLLWKLKTDNKTMGMQSFREPIIVAGVQTAGGVKTLAILGGSSDDIYAVDAQAGSLVWQKHLKWSSSTPQEPGQGAGFICNNALTATPVVTPAGAAQRFVYALASDGYLHTLTLETGDEKDAPIQMIPAPYGKGYGLNLANNVIYTATGQGCHGVPNEVYAVDLTNRKAFASSPGREESSAQPVPRSAPMERSTLKREMAFTILLMESCRPVSWPSLPPTTP